jgi:hypothetical protein
MTLRNLEYFMTGLVSGLSLSLVIYFLSMMHKMGWL